MASPLFICCKCVPRKLDNLLEYPDKVKKNVVWNGLINFSLNVEFTGAKD